VPVTAIKKEKKKYCRSLEPYFETKCDVEATKFEDLVA